MFDNRGEMDARCKGWLALSYLTGLLCAAIPWIWRTEGYLLVVLLVLLAPPTWLGWALHLTFRERVMHWTHWLLGGAPLAICFLWLLLADAIVARWVFESNYPFYRYSVQQAFDDATCPDRADPLK